MPTPAPDNLGRLWMAALGLLEADLGPSEVDGWLRTAQLVAVEEGTATLAVPSLLHRERIRERHAKKICGALSVDDCAFEIVEIDLDSATIEDEEPPASAATPTRAPASKPSATEEPLLLHPDYTFDEYVVGPCNRFAHAAASGVADSPAGAFNPLFLHGSVGLGKTHLMQAVAHRLRVNDPAVRITYLSCEQFVNHFVSAIQQGSTESFRGRYRDTDVLIVDDIQLLSNKKRTQEEFFNTFNTLHNAHKQIVLSSDAPPEEIPDLQERLVSRFKWGLVAEIETPCFETRVAILNKKAERLGLELPDALARFLAEHVDRNVRELEGILTRLHALARLENRPLTIELAQRALGRSYLAAHQRVVRIDDIAEVVTEHFGVRVSDLKSMSRSQSVVQPRHVSMFLARQHTSLSLEEVGRYFGGRDHSTVLYGVEKMEKRRRVDGDFASLIAELTRRIREGNSRS